jgi:Transposase, Mutator family
LRFDLQGLARDLEIKMATFHLAVTYGSKHGPTQSSPDGSPIPPRQKQDNEDESSKSLDCLLMEEIKRRTHVIRIFPNEESALRLIRALALENPRGLDRSPTVT